MSEKEILDLKEIIDKVVEDAFKRINYAYQHHREKEKNEDVEPGEGEIATRLIFPKYANNGIRISEQELRFAFVEAFNASQDVEDANLFYSVETPTEKQYTGFTKGKPMAVKDSDMDGRSGEFDLVILNDKHERVCLIEFKANNAGKSEHEKDLLKLKEEGNGRLCYFIEVLRSYSGTNTIGSLKNKFRLNNEDGKTIIRCFALEGESRAKEQKGEDISKLFMKQFIRSGCDKNLIFMNLYESGLKRT